QIEAQVFAPLVSRIRVRGVFRSSFADAEADEGISVIGGNPVRIVVVNNGNVGGVFIQQAILQTTEICVDDQRPGDEGSLDFLMPFLAVLRVSNKVLNLQVSNMLPIQGKQDACNIVLQQ